VSFLGRLDFCFCVCFAVLCFAVSQVSVLRLVFCLRVEVISSGLRPVDGSVRGRLFVEFVLTLYGRDFVLWFSWVRALVLGLADRRGAVLVGGCGCAFVWGGAGWFPCLVGYLGGGGGGFRVVLWLLACVEGVGLVRWVSSAGFCSIPGRGGCGGRGCTGCIDGGQGPVVLMLFAGWSGGWGVWGTFPFAAGEGLATGRLWVGRPWAV